MKSFKSDKKILGISEKLKRLILPSLTDQLAAVAPLRKRWEFLTERLENFQGKQEQLETEIGQLKALAIDATDDQVGESTRRLHDLEVELSGVETWIAELEQELGKLKPERSEAEKALWEGIICGLEKSQPVFNGELNGYLAEASKLVSSWLPAMEKLFSDLRSTDWSVDGVVQVGHMLAPLKIDPLKTNFRRNT